MGDDEMTTGATSRPGWRDVFEAVQQSEKRIIGHIDDLVGPLRDVASDHESRIRDLERNGSLSAQALDAKVSALHNRVDKLEDEEAFLVAREKGILATLTAGQKTVLFVAALISMAYAFVHLVEQLSI